MAGKVTGGGAMVKHNNRISTVAPYPAGIPAHSGKSAKIKSTQIKRGGK